MRKQWEYMIIWLPTMNPAIDQESRARDERWFDTELAAAGRQGWDAISMNNDRILLKRQL